MRSSPVLPTKTLDASTKTSIKIQRPVLQDMSKNTSNWADLPEEILVLIGQHLDTRVQVFRFRSVCSSWRSSFPLITTHQSSDLPVPSISTAVKVYRLEDETRNSACLIKLVESSSGNIHLLNVLSILKMNSDTLRKSLDVLNFRLIELVRGFYVNPMFCSFEFEVKRGVLFNEFGILAVSYSGKLGIRKFEDENWTVLGDELTHYDDLVGYKGQHYVVDSWGIVSWVDNESMKLVQFSPPLYGSGHLKNLIESQNQLYVIDAYVNVDKFKPSVFGYGEDEDGRNDRNYETADMRVYKLDEEWGTWVHVESLGDRVFVLAKECCFSVSVKDFPGCVGNCIYFMDPRPADNEYIDYASRLYKARVFRLDDWSIKSIVSHPTHVRLFSPEYMSSSCSTSALPCGC